jgi:hypothetical protein
MILDPKHEIKSKNGRKITREIKKLLKLEYNWTRLHE